MAIRFQKYFEKKYQKLMRSNPKIKRKKILEIDMEWEGDSLIYGYYDHLSRCSAPTGFGNRPRLGVNSRLRMELVLASCPVLLKTEPCTAEGTWWRLLLRGLMTSNT